MIRRNISCLPHLFAERLTFVGGLSLFGEVGVGARRPFVQRELCTQWSAQKTCGFCCNGDEDPFLLSSYVYVHLDHLHSERQSFLLGSSADCHS